MAKKKKDLIAALPNQCFWVHGGPILSDLVELNKALQNSITDEQFKYHVTNDKNDFASWVLNSLGDKKCSNRLSRVKKKGTAQKVVEECLKDYQN